MGNRIKTSLLLGSMTVLIVWIGYFLGGRNGMVLAFIIAAMMNFISYWYSDKIVLRLFRAKELPPGIQDELHQTLRDLAYNAQIPAPRIFVIPGDSPNAFATGRDPRNAVIAVTEGLLGLLSMDEMKGVLAHELAHIKNRDILIGSIAATMAGAIMIIASMARWTAFLRSGHEDEEGGQGFIGIIVMSIVAPIAAMLIQMAISRSREYLADESGAGFARDSLGLASALEKIGRYSGKNPIQANPNTAHMFIVNPLRGGNLANLFSTHPPLDLRIERLRGETVPKRPEPQSGQDTGRRIAEETWRRLK